MLHKLKVQHPTRTIQKNVISPILHNFFIRNSRNKLTLLGVGSVHLFIYLSISASIYPQPLYLFIFISLYLSLSTYLSMHLSVSLYIYIYIYKYFTIFPSIYLFISFSISPTILCIYLSLSQSPQLFYVSIYLNLSIYLSISFYLSLYLSIYGATGIWVRMGIHLHCMRNFNQLFSSLCTVL